MKCGNTAHGLSLLEWLVIVAVVVILVIILYPVIIKAREPYRGSCQNNMKELGTALNMYLGDYGGKLPSSIHYGHSMTWNRDSFVHFASVRGTLPPPDNARSQTLPMLLYPYMKNNDIIWCPHDPDRYSTRGDATVSYFYKAAVDRAWYGDGRNKMQKKVDFDFPSDQVIFYEHTGWHWDDEDKGLADGVTINMTFMDGHVAAKRIRNSGGKAITPAPAGGEPAWYNCSCGAKTPRYATGPYWNPTIWCDNLR